MKRPSISDHLAAALLSAVAGSVGICLSLIALLTVVGSLLGDGSVQQRLIGPLIGLTFSPIVFVFAIVPFGLGALMIGPAAYWGLARLRRTSAFMAATTGGALAYLCAIAVFRILGAPLDILIWVVPAGGTAAGWAYRRVLLILGAMPPPVRPS